MARCELTAKGPAVKNLVSHSNIKTKSKNMPNVQSKKLFSRTLNRQVTLKVATTTIRSLEARGGLDVFLLNAPDADLSRRALAVKYQIRRKISGGGKSNGEAKAAAPVEAKAAPKAPRSTEAKPKKTASKAKKTGAKS